MLPTQKICPQCQASNGVLNRACLRCGHAFRTLVGTSAVYDVSTRNVRTVAVDVWHIGIGKAKTIRGSSDYLVAHEARALADQWSKQWDEQQAKLQKAATKEQSVGIASQRTAAAAALQQFLRELLSASLQHPTRINWEAMKDRTLFPMASTPFFGHIILNC